MHEQMSRYLNYALLIALVAGVAKLAFSDAADYARYAQSVKLALRPVAILYLQVFGSHLAGLFLSMLIVVALLLVIWWFWSRHVRPATRLLDQAIAKLGRINERPGSSQALTLISQSILSEPALADEWHMLESVMVHRQRDGADMARSPIRPSVYFNMRALQAHGFNLRGFAPVPNYFVGAGLMLTFMGLVAGLFFAANGMKTADIEGARTALIQLLNASTLKFATSIAGIGSSIAFSIVLRLGTYRVESRIERLCRVIEMLVPTITPETLVQDQVDEGRRQFEHQARLEEAVSALTQAVEALNQRIGPPPTKEPAE